MNSTETVTFIAGIRQEKFEQDFVFPNDAEATETTIPFDESDVYPSLGVTFTPWDSWQFRAAYGKTVSRPTLTERANTSFYDDRNRLRSGNPNLETSEIDNFDLRAEYYFLVNGNVSLALFNKQIDKPVEVTVLDGSGSAVSGLTWANGDEATMNGVEFDINTNVFDTNSFTGFIGANLTYIDAEVSLSGRSLDLQTDAKRELQGQSPFVANFQFGFDHIDTNQKFTFLVNHFDDRIDEITRVPEELIYEAARTTLDFVYEVSFDHGSQIKFKAANITNSAIEFTQGDQIVEGWKEGAQLSLGYSYNF